MKSHFRYSTALVLLLFAALTAQAQRFDDYFTNKTLRIDYTFSGNAQQQMIAVDELCSSEGWYGKRQRLSEVPVEGNGQIIVCKHGTQQVLYRNSFSTLFQEWLSYDEAREKTRSFENVFLVPMPKDTVDVTLKLLNNRREVTATLTHTVVPTDILIRKLATRGTTPYEQVLQPADTSHCIRIAFIAEGYKEEEMPVFMQDVNIAVEALFEREPFHKYKPYFSVVAVKSPSVDSGTSEPGNGVWKNTALHSNFNTFYSDRYLTTLHLKDLHNWLAGIPYEHIIVLVNTEKYGGGGILNSYNLAMAHHELFRPVVVHEFGHSFAGLADEYAYDFEQIPMYPHDIEPWEQNITTQADFGRKWQDMVDKVPGVGLYEGAGYSLKGVWRPCEDCFMRSNGQPLCPVCERAIQRLIEFYVK